MVPIVNIQLLEGRTTEQKGKMAKIFTDALVNIGGASPEAIVIIFNDINKSDMAKAGKLVSEQN